MKKLLLFISPFIFCLPVMSQDVQTASSESTVRKCGTMENLEYLKQQDPTLEARMQAEEIKFEEYITDHQQELENSKTTYTIPCVVHIIYNGTGQNISDARVAEQITQTNADWAGTNGRSMEAFASTLRANTGITLCLAKKDPSGNTTTGITRTTTTVTSFGTNNNMKHTSTGGCDAWDPTKYFNIWVCNLGSSLCGYAQFPTSGINSTYGVAIHYQFFGHTGASAPYNYGGTLSHEGGHCFNLFHIWGDDGGSCSGSDNCNDTPNQASETYGNNSGVLTDACSTTTPGIMYMNFMDYSDDLDYANMTPNQATRMQSAVATYLLSVANSGNCSGSGIDEMEDLNNVSIFPNPSSGNIDVSFELNKPDDVKIYICNLVGDIVIQKELQKISVVNLPVDITELSAGVYYVKILTSTQTITKKISLIK